MMTAHAPSPRTVAKVLALALVLAVVEIVCSPVAIDTGRADSPFLKASGTVVRDSSGTGRVVNLRGTNLGGWLLGEGWMSPIGEAALPRTSWSSSASSTESSGSAANALDGQLGTRWSSGRPQQAGQTFMVDFGAALTFDQVTLDAGSSSGDYPNQFRVEASNDVRSWWTVKRTSGSSQQVVISTVYTKARYVRIVLEASSQHWWSIAEFNALVSDEFDTRRVPTQRFGAATTDSLIRTYQDAWIQPRDIDNITDLGFNLIRVPIYWQNLLNPDGSNRAEADAFRSLDWLVSEATSRGIYVLLDLHGAPGGDCPWHSCGQAGSNQLWSNATYQGWTIGIWQRVATHFRGNATVAGYDLLNEPLTTDGSVESAVQVRQKFDLLDRIYHAIRDDLDPEHLIVMPAFYDWASALPPSTYGWSNLMYETHYYDFADQRNRSGETAFVDQAISDIATYQQRWQVPVYAGEFWFAEFTDLTQKFLTTLNGLNVSWSNWTYKLTNAADGVNPDGVQNGLNWSFYYDSGSVGPDINTESAAMIGARWAAFATGSFAPNRSLQNLYRNLASPPSLAVPGRTQAEAFAKSGGGVQTEATADTGGGLNIGWLNVGDWVEYPTSAILPGAYAVDLRVASSVGSRSGLQIWSGGRIVANVDIPNTGGWQNWTTVRVTCALDAGGAPLRIQATGENWNLNWIDFARQ